MRAIACLIDRRTGSIRAGAPDDPRRAAALAGRLMKFLGRGTLRLRVGPLVSGRRTAGGWPARNRTNPSDQPMSVTWRIERGAPQGPMRPRHRFRPETTNAARASLDTETAKRLGIPIVPPPGQLVPRLRRTDSQGPMDRLNLWLTANG